ncbi:UDP-glucose 4-epimerase [Xaviernesmea oryzae]|uniref:UDP-glucose 4-epimerase n=1 Tax=Xaviernesmea oryzae TaxID=464029 RepID=A0A1Q9AZI2_9HYPH|nr:SDR family oxidoreductase [Xaviernesmea oryzae]OLP61105.1 UDP-glucose 4-epimerase [Xaviernesmea oryzae]SEL13221.1 Nucleoside-diphosphate-sugar epimerase [Xaviernesmea oryzae]
MTHVLVTGGTGLVGRFIVEDLLQSGARVTVAGRTPPQPGLFSRRVGFRPMRLDPDEDMLALFDDVYHLVHAAFSHVPGRYRGGEGDDPEGFLKANVDGSIRLFEAARDAGVRRCVFLSSRAVYGAVAGQASLSEADTPRPDTLYGKAKLAVERSLTALCYHAFFTASLRITGVYGAPRAGLPHKWQDLFADYREGLPIASRAGGEVHGADVAKAVRLMLQADPIRINGENFNVGDIVTDTHEILALFQKATGLCHPLPAPADPGLYRDMLTDRLRSLGWTPGGKARLAQTITMLATAPSAE